MNQGRTVFAQLLDFFPRYEFDKCVARYQGDHRVRRLSTYEQFLILVFAQLTYRESLRDIENCLGALGSRLYHSGLRQAPSRSTLAEANEKRDWRIFADFAQVLIRRATELHAGGPLVGDLTQNAVRTQVWTAVTAYLLVALVRKELKTATSLHAMLQIFSLTLFEKKPLFSAISDNSVSKNSPDLNEDPCLPGF